MILKFNNRPKHRLNSKHKKKERGNGFFSGIVVYTFPTSGRPGQRVRQRPHHYITNDLRLGSGSIGRFNYQ